MVDIWQELGIAPTVDVKAIRRAYAARLRAIDADRDLAAFQQLRAAYEAALRRGMSRPVATVIPSPPRETQADDPPRPLPRPQPPPPAPTADDPPRPLPRPQPPPPAPTAEDLERAQLRRDVNAALQAQDFRTALQHVIGGLARGTLSLGEREPVLESVMPGVVRDTSIRADDYLSLLRQSGWSTVPGARERVSPTRQQAMARGEAELWFLRLSAQAKHRTNRAARLLLRGTPVLFLSAPSIKELQQEIVRYRHYSTWIAHRFDHRHIARAEQIAAMGKTVQDLFSGLVIGALVLFGLACLAATVGAPPAFIGTILCFRVAYAMAKRAGWFRKG